MTGEGLAAERQPLQHALLFSRDGGATWEPLRFFVEGDQASFATEILPAPGPVSLRLVTSDGLGLTDSIVHGLTVGERGPLPVIVSPASGLEGTPDTEWTLSAWAVDPEDGLLAGGEWSSSINGPLGSQPVMEGVRLQTGAHVLRFEVTDSDGHAAAAETTVGVYDDELTDLRIAEDALGVRPPAGDPIAGTADEMIPGEEHRVVLSLENSGRVTTSTLELFVAPPGGPETLLAQRDLPSLQPFDAVDLTAAFTPVEKGDHAFRAVWTAVDPGDRDPANNVREWIIPTTREPGSGDANGDGVLDGADLVIMGAMIDDAVAEDPEADMDASGGVDGADFQMLRRRLLGE